MIVTGKSPLITEQAMEIVSPMLNCSSPNSNGSIAGATRKYKKESHVVLK